MALTNAQKQAAWRKRRQAHLDELEKKVKKLERENAKLKNELLETDYSGLTPSSPLWGRR